MRPPSGTNTSQTHPVVSQYLWGGLLLILMASNATPIPAAAPRAVFRKPCLADHEMQREAGASFLSSLWYTAWVRAAKPLLPGKPVQGACLNGCLILRWSRDEAEEDTRGGNCPGSLLPGCLCGPPRQPLSRDHPDLCFACFVPRRLGRLRRLPRRRFACGGNGLRFRTRT